MKITFEILDEESFQIGYQDGDFGERLNITDSFDRREDLAACLRAMREWVEEKHSFARARGCDIIYT